MKRPIEKAVTVLLMSVLLFSALQMVRPVAASPANDLKFIPGLVEIGVGHVDETPVNISVACVIEDAQELYGLDVQISWDTEYLRYVDHFYTMPVEDYPDPISPSPYNGTFYEGPEGGINVIKDKVDESGGISGAANSDVMYWLSVTEKGVCPEYYGSTTIFVMNFTVLKQPWDTEYPDYLDTLIHFESVDLSDSDIPPHHLSYTTEDGTVRLWSVPFTYPPRPKLKVMPETVEGIPVGGVFKSKVWLMGADDGDLDPFWDVQGIDMVMHFNTTMLNATGVTIDPTGWFGGFWPASPPIYEIKKQIDNTLGTVWIAFTGVPGTGGTHDAPHGQGIVAEVTFEALYESTVTPTPCAPIYLENTLGYIRTTTLHGEGLIDLSSPVSTDWTELTSGDPYHLNDWEDNGDGILSESDQIILNNTATSKYFDYHVDKVAGTLNLTLEEVYAVETMWAADFPDGATSYPTTGGGTAAAYDGDGNPYWTGLIPTNYPVTAVSSIHVEFIGNGTERDLDPSEYTVHPNGSLELLVPLDVEIINEHWVDGVNNSLNGWPAINYVASGIQSVYVKFPNGTERYAVGGAGCFESPPPCEWWYEPDWPYEVEGWYMLDKSQPGAWPAGTEWWVNYTAASLITVDYSGTVDPEVHYVEYDGTYDEFLALGNPINSSWNEVYPIPVWDYEAVDWVDSDTSGDLTTSDYVILEGPLATGKYHVNDVVTDIVVSQKECICTVDPSHEFYCEKPIVDVAGFPHPERDICPWHNSELPPPLPHTVEGATFCAKYKALGRAIDVYTQYPYPYGGQGPDKPSDAFGPQNEVILCANVTYNLGAVQQKLVTFEIDHVEFHYVRQDVSDENGIACVSIRVPWPCTDPEGRVFGDWDVTATVEIADVVVNDTLKFEVGYLIEILSITPEYSDYLKDDHMKFTVEYKSISKQTRTAYFTVTIYDELGVAIGYMILGPFNVTYNDGEAQTIVFECMTVPKWAYIGVATVYANALTALPSEGGSAYCPEVWENFSIVLP